MPCVPGDGGGSRVRSEDQEETGQENGTLSGSQSSHLNILETLTEREDPPVLRTNKDFIIIYHKFSTRVFSLIRENVSLKPVNRLKKRLRSLLGNDLNNVIQQRNGQCWLPDKGFAFSSKICLK